MKGDAIHDRTSFVKLCNASMKRNGQTATIYALPIFSGRKAKINLHTTLKLTVFMLISCLMRSGCHLVFERRDVIVCVKVHVMLINF